MLNSHDSYVNRLLPCTGLKYLVLQGRKLNSQIKQVTAGAREQFIALSPPYFCIQIVSLDCVFRLSFKGDESNSLARGVAQHVEENSPLKECLLRNCFGKIHSNCVFMHNFWC